MKMKNKKRVRAVHDLLKVFASMSNKDFKNISPFINNKGLKIISESIYNAIYNPDLPQEQKLRLKKIFWNHRDKLRLLADFKHGNSEKKVIVNQIGRGFPFIAQLIIPYLQKLLDK